MKKADSSAGDHTTKLKFRQQTEHTEKATGRREAGTTFRRDRRAPGTRIFSRPETKTKRIVQQKCRKVRSVSELRTVFTVNLFILGKLRLTR